MNSLPTLPVLPKEVLGLIFKDLPWKDLYHLALTCKSFHPMAQNLLKRMFKLELDKSKPLGLILQSLAPNGIKHGIYMYFSTYLVQSVKDPVKVTPSYDLLSEGDYFRNKKHGLWYDYNKHDIMSYHHGRLHGWTLICDPNSNDWYPWKAIFYDQGQIIRIEEYRVDKVIMRQYTQDQETQYKITYDNKGICTCKDYTDTGVIIKYYKKGELFKSLEKNNGTLGPEKTETKYYRNDIMIKRIVDDYLYYYYDDEGSLKYIKMNQILLKFNKTGDLLEELISKFPIAINPMKEDLNPEAILIHNKFTNGVVENRRLNLKALEK